MMGAKAEELLRDGKSNRVVAYYHGEYTDFDIEEALAMQKHLPEDMLLISRKLIR